MHRCWPIEYRGGLEEVEKKYDRHGGGVADRRVVLLIPPHPPQQEAPTSIT